jgi:hypothetical protein
VKPSRGEWTSGDCTGEGAGQSVQENWEGRSGVGYEEEARSGIGPGLKPSEFPRRSNHSILQA